MLPPIPLCIFILQLDPLCQVKRIPNWCHNQPDRGRAASHPSDFFPAHTLYHSQEYAYTQNHAPCAFILRLTQDESSEERLACNDQACKPGEDADNDAWYGLHCPLQKIERSSRYAYPATWRWKTREGPDSCQSREHML